MRGDAEFLSTIANMRRRSPLMEAQQRRRKEPGLMLTGIDLRLLAPATLASIVHDLAAVAPAQATALRESLEAVSDAITEHLRQMQLRQWRR
jgi:hypothetical protein